MGEGNNLGIETVGRVLEMLLFFEEERVVEVEAEEDLKRVGRPAREA